MIKICIIGSSGHFSYALEGIRGDEDAVIAGMAPGSLGENMAPLNDKVYKLGYSPQYFDDYIEMLDKLKPDVAVINSYFCDHASIILESLKRKIHIFAEKPIATRLEDLELIKEEHRKSPVKLAAMFGIRYAPWFITAWQAVQAGAIGIPRLINAQKSYKLGSRGENYKKRSLYGGTIPWVGSHAIDWVRWFSGEEFKSVFAVQSALYNQEHGDLEMSAQCQFSLTNEVMASVSIDYLRSANSPSHDDDRIRVAGTKGVIEVRQQKVYLINESEKGVQELSLSEGGNIFKDFLQELRGEGKCMVTAEDSIYVTEAALKAQKSADEKRIILWDTEAFPSEERR